MAVCVASAFVGGLKDVATHLQSDQLPTVSTACFSVASWLILTSFVFNL